MPSSEGRMGRNTATDMKSNILITGLQYRCRNHEQTLRQLEAEKPQVVLTYYHSSDYGPVVSVMHGSETCGVVCRWDLHCVLRFMHDTQPALVANVESTDPDGRCFTVSIPGLNPDDYDNRPLEHGSVWDGWHWTGPCMPVPDSEMRLNSCLQVVLTGLRQGNIPKRILLSHLAMLTGELLWDVSFETQQALTEIRRRVAVHADTDIRAMEQRVTHMLLSFGSKSRIDVSNNSILPTLLGSREAQLLLERWNTINSQCSIEEQRQVIDAQLRQLPADLYYDIDDFGRLMQRALYTNIPGEKLRQLCAAVILRKSLCSDMPTPSAKETELLLQAAEEIRQAFYGDLQEAVCFLTTISGMQDRRITTEVNRWIGKKRIDRQHALGELSRPLRKYGFYHRDPSTWNKQVKT